MFSSQIPEPVSKPHSDPQRARAGRRATAALANMLANIPNRVWLALLLIFYGATAAAFSIVNPIFEAPDEHHHYFAARAIAETQQLPVARAGTPYRQEGAQPPIYYLLAATLTLPWSPAPVEPALNPAAHTAARDAPNNHNVFLHPPGERWPWQGDVLLVHLLRFCSVLLGAGSLLCIYATARLIWRAHPARAIYATAAVAALPQWLFLHSAITNDTLLIFLVALTHCYLAWLWCAPRHTRQIWHAARLGVLIALAVLTKNTGLLLLPYVAIFLLVRARGRITRQVIAETAAVALPVLLLTGWHFWRNLQLYGDPTATNVFVELGGGARRLPAWFIVQHLDLLWLSLVAFFGWMNVLAPVWVFALWIGLVALALLGALDAWIGHRLARRQRSTIPRAAMHDTARLLLVQAVWPILVFAAWFQFNLQTPAEQGRLLFPAVIPVALWVGYGLSHWRVRWVPVLGLVAAGASALYCVGVLLPAAYPRLTVVDAPPEQAAPLHQAMGLGIDLVAAQTTTPEIHPGDRAAFTLYWRAAEPVSSPPLVAPELLGRDLQPVGALPAAYHGGGMFPASFWPRGAVMVENYRIAVDADARVPTLGRLYLRLEGQDAFVHAATVKITPRQWPAAGPTPLAELEGGIAIAHASIDAAARSPKVVSPGSMLPVHVRWQISQDVQVARNTFVHLGQPGEPPLVQADGPPLGGDYPTQAWAAGEVFDDEYRLDLPDDMPFGEYAVMIGLYDPDSGARVPLFVNGVRQMADALTVDSVTVDHVTVDHVTVDSVITNSVTKPHP